MFCTKKYDDVVSLSPNALKCLMNLQHAIYLSSVHYRVTYFVRFVPSFCSDDFICKTFCIPNSNLAHLRTLLNASVRFYFFEKLDFFTNAKLANEGHKFLGPMILLPTNKVGTFHQAIFFKSLYI